MVILGRNDGEQQRSRNKCVVVVCVVMYALMIQYGEVDAQGMSANIRTGPSVSSIQPNWKLAVSFDYAINDLYLGFGIDMTVSRRIHSTPEHKELLLNVIGFVTEARAVLYQSTLWQFSAGASVGARNNAYEIPSDAAFNPVNWLPIIPESPLGSTIHVVAIPFVQTELTCSAWLDVIARVGYDIHAGANYVDVSASRLTGPMIQFGLRFKTSK